MSQRRIEVCEISFREWIVCKVKRIQSCSAALPVEPESGRTKIVKARSGGDRRAGVMDLISAGREWRRVPERRMPEVNKSSFDEFERWRK